MIEDLGMQYATLNSKWRSRHAIYECPYCGKGFRHEVYQVKTGAIKSCGCLLRDRFLKMVTKHGMSGTRLYRTWYTIRRRCYEEKFKYYYNYGGRGIKVCDEWRNSFEAFRDWAFATGYSDDLFIDRIDNDGDYSPYNCRFVTRSVNTQNTRLIKSNNKSGYRGVYQKPNKRWASQITDNDKQMALGTFDTPEEAARAYNNWVIDHGTHHPLNIIPNNHDLFTLQKTDGERW